MIKSWRMFFGFKWKSAAKCSRLFPPKFCSQQGQKRSSGTETIYSGIDNGKDLEMAFDMTLEK